jgi:hypothetical protein
MWGAAMDVGDWLRGLGLGKYEETLRNSAIDMDVLADLTDGDLEKLGLPLGDRKRLLRAIATVASPAPAETRPAPALISPAQSSIRSDSAEPADHRHVLRSRWLDQSRREA